jgi:hypothetical protein
MKLGTGLALTNVTSRGNVGSSFTPTDISGLALWLDADDAATITQAAGAVSQWNDKSGNGYHATQALGSVQPITGTRTINGANTLDFDGSSDFLDLPSGLMAYLNTSDFDIFVVAATDSTTTFQHILGGKDITTADVRIGVVAAYNSNTAQAMCNPTYTASAKIVTKDTNQHVFGGTRTGAIVNSFYDGGALGANAAAANVNMNTFRIGQSGINTAYFNGVIAEIVICPVQTNSVRNLLMGYFQNKWGITWTSF